MENQTTTTDTEANTNIELLEFTLMDFLDDLI